MTPVELIRSLMDEHSMSESDLGRLLGDRSLGHRILSGQRELSKAHIRAGGTFQPRPRIAIVIFHLTIWILATSVT